MSELEDTLGLLVARLVHDLRNPLAVVLSNLHFLEGAVQHQDDREALEESLVSAGRMNRMLDDVLDLARLRRDPGQPARTPVSLAEVVRVLGGKLRLLTGNRSLTFDVGEQQLLCDPGLLERALLNLLEHALRHTPSRGEVRLEATDDGEGVVLRVLDGGAPFASDSPPSFLAEQLPLKQEPPPGCRSDQGMGLHFAGLALRALGARIDLCQREDGERGAAFVAHFSAELLA